MAYADYNTMMNMVETLFSELVTKICGSTKIVYDSKELDFNVPFKRIDIIPELEKCTGESFQFDENNVKFDYSSDDFKNFLVDLCQKHNVVCGSPITIPRLLDKLIGHFLESQCQNPTFLINHPLIMSPLAKYHRDNRQLSERFELFINHMELANAFTELNDHLAQENAFRLQQVDKKQGDDEVPLPDTDYVDSLKYGLPPTGGCGIGIDRLVMMLTGSTTIRDVVAFSA
jgi:lysyl-tRNA synthetase class 2